MLISSKSINININPSLWLYCAGGLATAAMVGGAAAVFFTGTVQADVQLARPIATLPPRPPVENVTPQMLAPAKPVNAFKAAMLRGLATWYGPDFHGHRTASGEIFDMYAMTACHPTLPFGTIVRVWNLRNKQSVLVRITDRGFLFDGRVIDLSYAAAQQLHMVDSGVAPVRLEVVSVGTTHTVN
jgi:rare lipoprotein A